MTAPSTTPSASDKKKAAKRPRAGQPTKYRPELCQEIVTFFSRPVTVEREAWVHPKKGGEPYQTTEIVAGDLPYFSEFAEKLGVHLDTLENWGAAHPEFAEAYARCKKLQEHYLVLNALHGRYNASFAIFTAKNLFGWRDTQDLEIRARVTEIRDAERDVGQLSDDELYRELGQAAIH